MPRDVDYQFDRWDLSSAPVCLVKDLERGHQFEPWGNAGRASVRVE